MAQAVITITDKGGQEISVSMKFGEGGIQEDSPAHAEAVAMLGVLTERLKAVKDEPDWPFPS